MLTSTDQEISKLLAELSTCGGTLRFLIKKGRREIAIADRDPIATANMLLIHVKDGEGDEAIAFQAMRGQIFEMFPHIQHFQVAYQTVRLIPYTRKNTRKNGGVS